ncbi:MAG: DNA-binding domain-containing protein, partial [Xanthobacteraceae bacterium]
MADADLGVLQRWMLSAVTTPGGVREGVREAREAYALDIGDAVKGSNRLSAPARLEIYARGYVLRLLECLRAEFPLLLALVGDQVFEMFASSYVWSRPSRSPSLYALGAGFADFLQSTRPDSGVTPG